MTEETVLGQPSELEKHEDHVIEDVIEDDARINDDGEEQRPSVDYRQKYLEAHQQNAELQRRVESLKPQEESVPELQQKPTLRDHDYDAASYEKALDQWYESKNKHAEQLKKQQQIEQESQAYWQGRVQQYHNKKTSYDKTEYQLAEISVVNHLTPAQQGIIIQCAEDSAGLVWALGRDQSALERLSHIKDPFLLTAEVVRMENILKNKTRTPPPPERMVVGNASVTETTDEKLKRLRKEAERTGDFTQVFRYKKQQRRG